MSKKTLKEHAARPKSIRLTDFNNDPSTTLADIQKLLQLVEERLAKRLAEAPAGIK